MTTSQGFAQLCENALYSNLLPGDTAIVVTPDNSLNMRQEPGLHSSILTTLPENTSFKITAGPRCEDRFAWYQGQLEDGQLGWVVESDGEDYFLGKLPRNFSTYTTPSDIYPEVEFTHLSGSMQRIVQDTIVAHGKTHDGTSTILFPLDGEPIFINIIAMDTLLSDPELVPHLEKLQILLDLRSDEAFDEIPEFTNMMGEPRQLIAQQNFLDFQSGTGLRYIAFYAEDDSFEPVQPEDLEYTFHGITADGHYYINVSAPGIASPQLPHSPPENPDEMSAYFEGYAEWIIDIEQFLSTIAPASFTPRFGMIDRIIYSLYVGE